MSITGRKHLDHRILRTHSVEHDRNIHTVGFMRSIPTAVELQGKKFFVQDKEGR